MDCAGRAIAPYTHFHFGRFFRTPVPPHPNPLPKERESHLPARRKIETLRMVPNRTTILPLLGERVGVRGKGLNKAVGALTKAPCRLQGRAKRRGRFSLRPLPQQPKRRHLIRV